MMYIEYMVVLCIVDTVIRFSSARFLSDIKTSLVWAASVKFRASIYVWLRNRIKVD